MRSRKTLRIGRLDRAQAEVLGVGHAQAPEIAALPEPQGAAHRRDSRADRRHRSRLRRQQQARVGDGAAHRPDHRDRRPAEPTPLDGHEAGRRPEADDAVDRRGNAQRSAGVGARAHRQHVGRERHGRAARRAAGIERGIERIAGGAPHDVAGVGAGAELRHVGLGRDDRAGRAHARDHGVVVLGHEVAIQRRAVGRQQPAGLVEVLDAGRQPVQRPSRSPCSTAFSAAFASLRARSKHVPATALTAGLIARCARCTLRAARPARFPSCRCGGAARRRRATGVCRLGSSGAPSDWRCASLHAPHAAPKAGAGA